ncbi:MAG: glutathione S-transferase [Pseudomonadota bacterium]
MSDYKLHCFAQSGNAYKVALALELAGADWEPVWVDFFKGGNRTPEFTEMNAMAEVPVLEHGGQIMSQTGVMLDYLTEALGKYAASDPREALRWILFDNHKLTSNMATWRFLTNFAPEKMRNPDVIGFLKGRAVGALKVLNTHLDGRDWIVGDALSTADLSCQGYIHYADEYDFDWAEVPNVTAWRDRIQALPGWKHPYDLMPGHPIGSSG